MKFVYFNPNNQKVSKNLKAGQKWNEVKTSNKTLNSIFNNIDNGDGIIQQEELDALNLVFKEKDKNKNKTCDNDEMANISKYSKKEWQNIVKGAKIAELINDDLSAKTFLGLPTTGKDISKHIKMINKDNALTVINIYQDRTNESLFSGIMGEIGLSYKERARYCKHIMKMLVEKYKEKGIYTDDIVKEFNKEIDYQRETWTFADAKRLNAIVDKLIRRDNNNVQTNNTTANGKIDKDFKQGNTGDCWLLSPIKALSNSPKGLKILNDSIKVDKNGNVTVTLKGVNKSYTFTKEEINRNTQLSTGDLDVRAVEMAVDRYFAEERGSDNTRDKIDINSNQEYVAFQILTGKTGYYNGYKIDSKIDKLPNKKKISPEQITRFNDQNHIVCVSAHSKNKDAIMLKATDNSNAKLEKNHSYTVSRADSNYVYLINPWNTSKEIPVDIKTFTEFFDNIYELDL